MTWTLNAVDFNSPKVYGLDNFTAADGTNLTDHTSDSGGAWSLPVATYNHQMTFASNRLRCATSFSVAQLSQTADTDEYRITGKIRALTAGTSPLSTVGIVFRLNAATQTWYYVEILSGSSDGGVTFQLQARLWKVVNNVLTKLAEPAAAAFTWPGDITFTIDCTNTQKSFAINGNLLTGASNDNSIPAGKNIGVYFPTANTATTGHHVDSLQFQSLPLVDRRRLGYTPPLRKHYTAIGTSAQFDVPTLVAAGVDTVIMQAWKLAQKAALQAAGIKCFVYKNSISANGTPDTSTGTPLYATGLSQAEVLADSSLTAARLMSGATWCNTTGFSGSLLMDPGSAAYQARWVSNVRTEALANGWDGVFMDDINAHLAASPTNPDLYPDDTNWEPAVKSFVQAVSSGFAGTGLKLFPNLGGWFGDYPHRHNYYLTLLPYVDQALLENFCSFENSSGTEFVQFYQTVTTTLSILHDTMVTAQKPVFCQAVGKTTTTARYATACALLRNEPPGLSISFQDAYSNYPLDLPEMHTALGHPVEDAHDDSAAGANVFYRYFENGVVVVNNTTSAATITLTGGTYSGSTLTAVTTFSAPAQSGFVLLRN